MFHSTVLRGFWNSTTCINVDNIINNKSNHLWLCLGIYTTKGWGTSVWGQFLHLSYTPSLRGALHHPGELQKQGYAHFMYDRVIELLICCQMHILFLLLLFFPVVRLQFTWDLLVLHNLIKASCLCHIHNGSPLCECMAVGMWTTNKEGAYWRYCIPCLTDDFEHATNGFCAPKATEQAPQIRTG